jgi:hypothetical protein
MGGSVLQDVPDIDDWVSGLRSFIDELVEGFLHSSDIFWWNRSSHNFIHKLAFRLPVLALRNGLNIPSDSSVLTSTSCLFFMKIVEMGFLTDGFTIVDPRRTHYDIHSELSFHPFNVDLKMKLSHPTDDDLLRLFVNGDRESWILSLEFRQGFAELC